MLRSLYRLQTRLGLTGPEGSALLIVALALAVGLGVSEWRSQQAPPVAELYQAQDAAFAAALVPTAQAAAPPPPTHDAPAQADAGDTAADLPSLADGALPPDTTVAEAPEPPPAVVGPVADAPRRSRKKEPAVTNVNTAPAEQLASNLPRIGPALAGRIVEYRRQFGPFRSAEQLVEVRGIGEKTLEGLRPWVRL